MSAPCATGLHRNGLGTVLSTTSGTPCERATSATAAMSSTMPLGLPSVSANTARVFGRIAAANAAGSVASTKLVSMPNFFRFTASIVTVPPYSAPAATTWSPDCRIVISAIASAAMPLAQATAARAALERRHAFFQRGHGRVAQARIDVAEGLQVEQAGGVVGAVEDEARGLVDRQRPRAGGGVGDLAGVDGQGLGLELAVGHRASVRPAACDDITPVFTPAQCRPPNSRRVLDLDATVHHRVHAGTARQRVGLGIGHADLLPQAARADLHRLARDRQHVLGAPEDVDHVDALGDLRQRSVHGLAQDRLAGIARVHRDHAVAMLLQVLGDEVARPVPLRRQADHRYGATVLEDAPQGGDVVGHGKMLAEGQTSTAARR